MPVILKNTPISCQEYNSLPFIQDASDVPRDHAQDLVELERLMEHHRIPEGVFIRLVHKHYEINADEVVVFQKVAVPNYPDGHSCRVMSPISIISGHQDGLRADIVEQGKESEQRMTKHKDNLLQSLQGIHYHYDAASQVLQAYEYGDSSFIVPDMSAHQAFLAEFCNFVSERGLERKFGLKLDSSQELGVMEGNEFELEGQRSTITFYDSLPLLPWATGNVVVSDWRPPSCISAEPHARNREADQESSRAACQHNGSRESRDVQDNHLGLCGEQLILGSELHSLVTGILASVA